MIDGPVLDDMNGLAHQLAGQVEGMLADYPPPIALAVAWRAVSDWLDRAPGYAEAAAALVQAMSQRTEMLADAATAEPAPVLNMPTPEGVQ